MNNKIEPTYVTFEQAKLLKEKGLYFPLSSDNCYWTSDGKRIASYNWFTPEELSNYVDSLQQWQVVEFLRINHSIWVEVRYYEFVKMFIYEIVGLNNNKGMTSRGVEHFDTPQKAYSAAFDYILKELI
jgi:hypothetical protein